MNNSTHFQTPKIALLRRSLYLLVLVLATLIQANAQIAVTVSGSGNASPSLAASYASLSDAIAALNTVTTLSGPVTFELASGTSETVGSQQLINFAGDPTFPVTFQKSGAGANPILTRTDAGTLATSTIGGLGDAVIRIDGTDNLHFDGLDVSTSLSSIEYGYFTSKTATNACQNISFKNLNVTMTKGTSGFVIGIHIGNGTTSVSSATGVTVSATTGRTENVTITGCTIQNVHTPVYCRGNSTLANYDQNFVIGAPGAGNGNTFQNFGGGATSTTYGVYFIYTSNVSVSNNTINNAGAGGSAHASTFYGIFFSTVSGTVVGSDNNIILNTSGTSAVHGIYNANSVTSNTFSNNSFSGTIAATTTSNLIYASSATPIVNIIGNQISGSFSKISASGILYCYYNLGGPTSGTETITNNNFSNITTTGTGAVHGIYSNTAAAQTRICHSNTISNWSIASTAISYGIYGLASEENQIYNNTVHSITGSGSGALVGIYFTGVNATVYNNLIYGLTSGTPTTTFGMQVAATGFSNVYGNKIYDLTNNNSASTASNLLTGIHVSTNALITAIYNNLIGNLQTPNSISADAIRGVNFAATTTSTSIGLYFNTIYLNASSTGINFGTTGVFHTTSATLANGYLHMRNNIIHNNSIASGTGIVAAYRRSNATTSNYNAVSDRNLFYAGTASPAQVIFTDGTVFHQTLGDYKAYMSLVGADQNSYEENTTFVSTTGSSPDFLQFDPTIGSYAESGGANITGITTDYASTIRQGNPGYGGTGSGPDLGAWELEGTALGGCAGEPTASSAMISISNPCANINFSLTLDVAFGLGYSLQWESSTTGPALGFSPISGATNPNLITNTSVTTWYRCIVTCVSSGLSTTSLPVEATIASPLSGTYSIDNLGSGDYISFDAALTDLNCKGTSGPVIFQVTAGQVFNETANLELIYSGSVANTITFERIGAGANPLIRRSGSSATNDYVLKLTGVDFYTFNGIDIEQTGTTSADWVEYGVWITNASTSNGAKNNTFRNGTITLDNNHTASRGVFVGSAFTPIDATGTQSSNRFLNMTVQNAWEGYRITGSTNTFPDDANEVNTESGGNSVIRNIGNGVGAVSLYGVFSTHQTNLKIMNTEFDNFSVGGTSLMYGITCQTSTANSVEIADNTMHGFTGSGTQYGIYFSSMSTANVYNNRIYNFVNNSATSASVRGIYITATGSVSNIYNNRIYDLQSNGLTTTSVAGIDCGTGTFTVYNNMISDLRAPSSTTTTGGTRGISITGGTASAITRIYYNTIYLNDIAAVAAYTSAGIHNSSTTPSLDIRNNIVMNMSDVAIGTRAVAFWKTATTDNVAATCNNNIYYAGTPSPQNLIYYDGTNSAETIAQYNSLAAITPAESFTQTESVNWQPIVDGILRPDAGIPTVIESGGAAISGFSEDFEADVRDVSTPDIGADEGTFTILLPALPDCATLNTPANMATDICAYSTVTLNWSAAMTGGPAFLGYDVFFGTTPTPPFVANVNTSNYVPTGILPNTTYYWYVLPKNVTGSPSGCTIHSFTTINAEVTSVINDTRCGPGVVNLGVSGSGTFNWYANASGGSSIASGSTYSPSIASSTNFYVAATDGGINANVGPVNPSIGSISSSTIAVTTQYMTFDVLSPLTITTLNIYPTASIGSTFNISIRNSSGVEIFNTGSLTTTVTGGATPQTVNVNASLPIGSYRIGLGANPGMQRNTTGAVYPYTIPGVISLTGNSFDPVYYYFLYNIGVSSGCEGPRTLVTATVNPVSSDTVSITACNSYTWAENNQTYTNSGFYVQTYVNTYGCDSNKVLNLTLNYSIVQQNTISANGCYTWAMNGQTYSNSGMYTHTEINAGTGCLDTYTLDLTVQAGAGINLKAILAGPYVAADGLMHDSLRVLGYIPSSEPYTSGGFAVPILCPSGETVAPGVFAVSGPNAIVDWVLVEARHASNPSTILANVRALIQRDGDIVTTDGQSAVFFTGLTEGNYYIAIKHRNHMGIMSASPVALIACNPGTLDLSNANPVFVKAGISNAPRKIDWG
jgi:hypothetical protein